MHINELARLDPKRTPRWRMSICLSGLLGLAACTPRTNTGSGVSISERSSTLAQSGITLANVLWWPRQDPLGEHLDHYDDINDVPVEKFSNSTEYFQMAVDEELLILDLVTTSALVRKFGDVYSYPSNYVLARTSVIWCVVAGGVINKGRRYPALMTRNVHMNTVADDIRVEEDPELGIDVGVIVDNMHDAHLLKCGITTNFFNKDLTNRVLRP